LGFLAIAFAVDVLISTLCVWLATKLSFVKIEAKEIALIVLAASVVSLVPVVGWIAGFILFIYLLYQVSGCTVIDAAWVVLFTKVFSFFAVLAIGSIS